MVRCEQWDKSHPKTTYGVVRPNSVHAFAMQLLQDLLQPLSPTRQGFDEVKLIAVVDALETRKR